MVIKELAHLLDLYYDTGKNNKEIASMVLCFGIKYADVIREKEYSPEDIVQHSSINDSQYAIEIRKGMNLAKYVCLKEEALSYTFNAASVADEAYIANNLEFDWLEAKLRAVGKRSFVFHLLPELQKDISVTVEDVAARHTEFREYGLDSQKSKLSSARTIFKEGKVKEALKNIMESKNVDEDTRQRATFLLRC